MKKNDFCVIINGIKGDVYMKKITKLATSLLLAVITIVASIFNVNAATSSIDIGTARPVHKKFIGNREFAYKVTTDGRYVYCVEESK